MRGFQVQLLLALAALLLAVGVRRRTGAAPLAEGAPLVSCEARSVRLETAQRRVRVERHDDDIAVEVTRREAGQEARVRFVGGEAALELLEQLGALRAERTLPETAEGDYGFDDGASLVIGCAGAAAEPHVFAVGDAVYGSEDRYVRDAEGVTHVLAASFFRVLEGAEVLLMRRELHPFDEAAVAQVVATLPAAGEVRLMQRFGADPARRRWVDPEQPDERAPRLDRLMGAHRNLRAEAGTEPSDEAEPLATLRYLDEDGRELGTLRVVRLGRGPGAEIHAHTEHVGWVRLPRSTGQAFARALERLGRP